jgi:hypothetical protein
MGRTNALPTPTSLDEGFFHPHPALGGYRHTGIAREVGLAGMSVPKVGPPMAEEQGSAPGMLKGSRMPRPGFR